MRSNRKTLDTYYLEIFATQEDFENANEEDHAILSVLYCDRATVCPDVAQFLKENFLTTLQVQRIAPDTDIILDFYAAQGESLAYTADILFRISGKDGTQSARIDFLHSATATRNEISEIWIEYADLIREAADIHQVQPREIEILSVTVTAGLRSATFYVDETLDSSTAFLFHNCFNVEERATLQATTTTKTDVSRSTAIVGGKSQFYNQNVTKSHEVQTAPLTSDEAAWIDQLFTAHEVYRIIGGSHVPVLITDSTCEVQDGDEKLNSVKFTWRFADNRPAVSFPSSPNIFNENYNTVYS